MGRNEAGQLIAIVDEVADAAAAKTANASTLIVHEPRRRSAKMRGFG